MIDFDAVRKMTETNILSWATRIVPNGKLQGKEYAMINPTRADNKEGSFSINTDTGLWADFAVGAKGGDVIGLYAYVKGCTQLEAAKAISGMAGMEITETKKTKKPTLTPLIPITFPDKIPAYKGVEPSLVHQYINGYVLRYDLPSGKTYMPYNYGIFNEVEGWHWKQIENNRPLYNLQYIKDTTKSVILVEGEKAADALYNAIDKSFLVMTWAGGSNAYTKTDFSPIYGKNIILWADADPAGKTAMYHIGCQLIDNGCNIKQVDVSSFPDKYDAADWVVGKESEEIKDYLRTKTIPFSKSEEDVIPESLPLDYAPAKKERIRKPQISDLNKYSGERHKAPEIRTESPEDLPYFTLGYQGNIYVFYSRQKGCIVKLTADKINESNLLDVHAELRTWERLSYRLCELALKQAKGTEYGLIREHLIQNCIAKGYFDDSKLRSTGAWLDNGKIVVHLGDKVFINGQFYKPSEILSEFIYIQSQPIRIEQTRIVETTIDASGNEIHEYESYMPEPLDTSISSRILELIKKLKWEYREAGILLAGWCAISPVGGALPWRPHIWITAPAGSGKTTVMNQVIGNLLGGMSEPILSGSTESGLRRDLNNKTIPIIFDEAESETSSSATSMEKMLTLIRRSSATTRGKTKMAARTGSGIETFTSSSCFCLSSIVSTLKCQADVTRFTVLNLLNSKTPKDRNFYNDVIEPEMSELLTPANCDAFLMRSISNIDAILHNIIVFKKAMSLAGHSSRLQDQYSPMFAGAYLYESTDNITEEEAQARVAAFNFDIFEQETVPQEQENVFMYILSSSLSVKDDPSQTTRTIGWMIEHVMKNQFHGVSYDASGSCMKVSSAIDKLKEYGIKVCHESNNVFFHRNSIKIRDLVKYNPQWYNWSKIMLDDDNFTVYKEYSEPHQKPLAKNLRIGAYVGNVLYAPFSFFENGVSFENIRQRIVQEEPQPF